MHYQTILCVKKSLPGVPERPLGPPRPLSPSKPGDPDKPAKTQQSENSSLLCHLVSSGNTRLSKLSLPHLWLQDFLDLQADQETHLVLSFQDSRTGPLAQENQGSLWRGRGKYVTIWPWHPLNITLHVVLKENCSYEACLSQLAIFLTHYSRLPSFTGSSLHSGETWASWETVVTGDAVIGTATWGQIISLVGKMSFWDMSDVLKW